MHSYNALLPAAVRPLHPPAVVPVPDESCKTGDFIYITATFCQRSARTLEATQSTGFTCVGSGARCLLKVSHKVATTHAGVDTL
jgi:hypothetical protein